MTIPSGASAACSALASASRRLAELAVDLPDPAGAEIALGDRVIRLLAVLGTIIEAAEQPDFLGAEPDDADGPQRPAGIHDPLGGGGGDRDAGGIVDRAGAKVPAVEMAADQQDRRVGSRPGTSAMTLPDWRVPMLRGMRTSRIAPACRA